MISIQLLDLDNVAVLFVEIIKDKNNSVIIFDCLFQKYHNSLFLFLSFLFFDEFSTSNILLELSILEVNILNFEVVLSIL